MLPAAIRFIQRGWFSSNTILLLGEHGPVVVDTGHRRAAPQLLQLMRAQGVEAQDVRLIVNTHCHALNPAIALPGHGGILTDPRESLEALLARLRRFQAEPARLARHLVRRVLMASLLEVDPIARQPFVAAISRQPWLRDYAPCCGFREPARLAEQLLDEYLARGLVRVTNGLLASTIPR